MLLASLFLIEALLPSSKLQCLLRGKVNSSLQGKLDTKCILWLSILQCWKWLLLLAWLTNHRLGSWFVSLSELKIEIHLRSLNWQDILHRATVRFCAFFYNLDFFKFIFFFNRTLFQFVFQTLYYLSSFWRTHDKATFLERGHWLLIFPAPADLKKALDLA